MKKLLVGLLVLGSVSSYAKIGCDVEYFTNSMSGTYSFSVNATESWVSGGGIVAIKRSVLGLGKVKVYAQDRDKYGQYSDKYLEGKFKVQDLLDGKVAKIETGDLFIEVKNCVEL